MKKFLLIISLILCGLSYSEAQEESPARREKMFREVQDFKMRYLAQEMDLSELQKKRFFELYEEMSESKKECYEEAVKLDREIKQDKDASDADYQQVTEAFNKANIQWSEEEKQYNEKLAEFLSPKQIYKMREAENTFRAKLDEMRHSRKKEHHRKTDNKVSQK